ncbi:MAG: AbrB/MazE/SpoVT family DNA-binding domain-containing protein [Saprospiraceae bacterium]|nr:AbrB/MazE/SpoVT family DNA-binding domain-containing protein [Saprospiraceae bacterium]
MELNIIRMGNSKGIRLSKTILDKYGIKDKVELVLEKDFIVFKAISNPREGWDKEFSKMNKNGDDRLVINVVFSDKQFEEMR